MPTIDINNTNLYYESSGEGPTMLFVHGLFGDADSWAGQAERFSGRYRCVRYDRRGHSRSERGDAVVDWDLHTADLVALIEALELAPCMLVGSSSGAAIGVEVALRHGDLLRSAVLSEPALWSIAPAAGEALAAAVMPLVESAVAAGGARAGVDAFCAAVCPGLWAMLDEAGRNRFRDNAGIGLADLRSSPLMVTTEDLPSITVPTLVIRGDSSHPSFRDVTEELAARPDARLVELADCGHVTYAERPDEFAAAVAAFASETDLAQPAPRRDAMRLSPGLSASRLLGG